MLALAVHKHRGVLWVFAQAGCDGMMKRPSGSARGVVLALVRQAKLGASCRVRVPAEQGLANRSYRVLRMPGGAYHRTKHLKRTQGTT